MMVDTQSSGRKDPTWFSSYATLIASSLFDKLRIKVPTHDELRRELGRQGSIYSAILHLPVMNIFNGILFQQAMDYQVYLQKLFVDYRLSPEFAKDEEASGFATRQDLDALFNETKTRAGLLSEQELKHYQQISDSQAWIIQAVSPYRLHTDKLPELMADTVFIKALDDFTESAKNIEQGFSEHRSGFYDLILQTTEKLRSLTDYRMDPTQNRENIQFQPLSMDMNEKVIESGLST